MIKITVNKKDNLIIDVTIVGHANYADIGNDIVCAGVSAIGVGTVNAISKLTATKKPEIVEKEGYLKIEFPVDYDSQLIARTMLIQLESIEEAYPKNIKINK